MSDSSHHGNELVEDAARKGSAANNGNWKLMNADQGPGVSGKPYRRGRLSL